MVPLLPVVCSFYCSAVSPADFRFVGPLSVDPPRVVSGRENDSGANDDAPAQRPMFPIAKGFGKDIPLSFAARQIIPNSFHIGFDDAVARNQTVSWTGGRPWPAVLHDVVHGAGLHFRTIGQTVRISP